MIWGYLFFGALAGVLSGFLGIGGGTILIPVLIYIYGLTQHQAQGTTLAILIPPIGLLAALKYYFAGNVKINIAVYVCVGFFVGGLIGAVLAHKVNDFALRKAFGFFLLLIALKMLAGK